MSNQAPIEERLRAALEARGRLISAHDLSPVRPPSGRTWGTRRIRRVLSVAVAAAAAAVLLLSSNTSDHPRPAPPARHSSPTPTVPHPVPSAVPHPVPSADPSGP